MFIKKKTSLNKLCILLSLVLRAFFELAASLLRYALTFFFNKTRALKNKSFLLILLSLSDRAFFEPFCECSFLQQKVPFFSAIVILTSLLAYLYLFYIWWSFKSRNQVKNKFLINLYLKFSFITFLNLPVTQFFLFETFHTFLYFFYIKFLPFLNFIELFYNRYLKSVNVNPFSTKIIQYIRNKLK